MSKIKKIKIEGHNFLKCMDAKIKNFRNCLNNYIMCLLTFLTALKIYRPLNIKNNIITFTK